METTIGHLSHVPYRPCRLTGQHSFTSCGDLVARAGGVTLTSVTGSLHSAPRPDSPGTLTANTAGCHMRAGLPLTFVGFGLWIQQETSPPSLLAPPTPCFIMHLKDFPGVRMDTPASHASSLCICTPPLQTATLGHLLDPAHHQGRSLGFFGGWGSWVLEYDLEGGMDSYCFCKFETQYLAHGAALCCFSWSFLLLHLSPSGSLQGWIPAFIDSPAMITI